MTQVHHRKKDITHGTTSGYRHYGCRCDLCHTALIEYERERRDKKRTGFILVGPKPIRHGTAVGYRYHGCRCDECSNYTSQYRKDLRVQGSGNKPKKKTGAREERELSPEKQRQCGTAEAYSFGCTCELCLTQGFQHWIKEIAA